MPTEFYRPTTPLLATFSMAFAVGLGAQHAERDRDVMPPTTYIVTSPEWVNATAGFYSAASGPLDEAAQIAALESFGSKLLDDAVEPPQSVVDLLNERFWDLV